MPCIIQWVSKIKPATLSNHWAANTDFIPTFLEAAGIEKPKHVKYDGVSFLPILIKDSNLIEINNESKIRNRHKHNQKDKERQNVHSSNTVLTIDQKKKNKSKKINENKYRKLNENINNENISHYTKEIQNDSHITSYHNNKNKDRGRVFLWHKDTEETPFDVRIMSAGYYDDLKIITYSVTGTNLFLFIYLFIYSSIYLFIYLFIHLFIYPSTIFFILLFLLLSLDLF